MSASQLPLYTTPLQRAGHWLLLIFCILVLVFLIAPVLVATEAGYRVPVVAQSGHSDRVLEPILCNADSLGAALLAVLAAQEGVAVEPERWEAGRYSPSPTIIEAATQLLPALPIKLALATQQQLVNLGVVLKMGRRVTEITKEGITTSDGEFIEAELKVWAAGIKAPDWLKDLDGLETNHINQLVVDSTLKTNDDNIFAMGDCAACVWQGHNGNVPPRAQAAHQQASVLCQSIINRIKGRSLKKFVYYDYGSLVSLGKYTTVGNLMGNLMGTVSIGGFIAKVVYLSLYKMHQVAIHGYFRTTMLTLSNAFRRSVYKKIKMH